MQQLQFINIANQLPGLPVREEGTTQAAGLLADIIVHPGNGTVLGMIVRTTHGELRGLATRRLQISDGGIVISLGTVFDPDHLNGPLTGGAKACGELIGISVVTEEGKLLGRISEVHLAPESMQVVYRVSSSRLQQFFDHGFFIAGDIVHAYSRTGARLIVPARTKELHATPLLSGKINPRWKSLVSNARPAGR